MVKSSADGKFDISELPMVIKPAPSEASALNGEVLTPKARERRLLELLTTIACRRGAEIRNRYSTENSEDKFLESHESNRI